MLVRLWDTNMADATDLGLVDIPEKEVGECVALKDENGNVYSFWNFANSEVNFVKGGTIINITSLGPFANQPFGFTVTP